MYSFRPTKNLNFKDVIKFHAYVWGIGLSLGAGAYWNDDWFFVTAILVGGGIYTWWTTASQPGEKIMELIKAIESSIVSRNYYGALFPALSAPDICGFLESPTDGSQVRYEKWFEKYMLDKYSSHVGASGQMHVFLSPSDCYALRCALLHEGREEITEQRARKALDRFHFVEPPQGGGIVHCNQIDSVLQLQVDIFCNDIVGAIRTWVADTKENADVQQRLEGILRVYPTNQMP